MYFISEKKDNFLSKILEGVSQIDQKIFKKDYIRLNSRFSLRKDGKCIIGIVGRK